MNTRTYLERCQGTDHKGSNHHGHFPHQPSEQYWWSPILVVRYECL